MGIILSGNGRFDYEIVGESFYQAELKELAGGYLEDYGEVAGVARLFPYDENRYDPLAVGVVLVVGDTAKMVGHLSRKEARRFRKEVACLTDGGSILCRAAIVGGWDNGPDDRGHFGVKLDLEWPLSVRARYENSPS